MQVQEMTGEVPQALKNRPVLEPRLRYFESVFYDLSSDRDYTSAGSPKAIPTPSILAYCELFYIEDMGERERLFRAVRVMDRAFVKELSAKIKRQQDSSGSGKGTMNTNVVS